MNSWKLCAFADEADALLSGQIKALKDNDILLLEIRGVNGKNISELTAKEARDAKQELKEAGIGVWSIGSPTGKISITDDFAPHRDSFRHLLELAVILGASRYRLFSFYGYDGSTAARDTVMERLSILLKDAAGSGLVLCHENEKDIYGEKADACLDIHTSLSSLKAVFDPANFVQSGQDTLEAWEMLAPYVDYLHIKDALADGQVVPAGNGAGNIPAIINRYAEQGGKILTLEPHLADFIGFQKLEGENKSIVGGFSYSSAREAFDSAAASLKRYLN